MSGQIAGKRVLITKSQQEAGEAFNIIELAGGEVVPFPAIKIEPAGDFSRFDAIVRDLENYDYLIFSSANTVKVFAGRIRQSNINPDYERIEVICTGSKTAEACNIYGIPVSIVPEEFSAGGIINFMSGTSIKSKKIFIPCSELAGNELKTGLEELGGIVTQIPVYNVAGMPESQLSRQIELISERKPDVFAFTSPSNFRNFISIMGIDNPAEYFADSIVAAIGPTTEKSVAAININVEIVPAIYTLEALAESIINYLTLDK